MNQIETAAQAALDRKATDVVRLDVGDIIGITDHFLVFTTKNDRQLDAASEEIEYQLREQHGRKPLAREGSAATGWMVTDYGDYVVHGFLTDTRDLYALDRLWSDAPSHKWDDGEPDTDADGVTIG
ncbi:ribosome silencing factor [Stomatohabitans albus]|uniref:ribosome silencing factor n=1 Tax=Stomatohabitans albus TaxID=3110766 RepID=UPI00300CDEFB